MRYQIDKVALNYRFGRIVLAGMRREESVWIHDCSQIGVAAVNRCLRPKYKPDKHSGRRP